MARPLNLNRRITTIYLTPSTKEEIDRRKLNLSSFINKVIYDQFLSFHSKVKEIDQLKQRIDELQISLDIAINNLVENTTEEQRRDILTMPERLNKGYNKEAILRGFTEKFKRQLTQDELDILIEYYLKKV
jgi:hypothetical protein